MPIPIDQRGKAASVKIHLTSGAGVDIGWVDGHQSHYAFDYLREQCPCALCNEERRKAEDAKTHMGGGGLGSSALLPMFKPRPKAVAAQPVGNYALQIDFNDGHRTGIYSFDYLRTICPCEACAPPASGERVAPPANPAR